MSSEKDLQHQPSRNDALLSLIEKTYAVAIKPEKLAEFLSTLAAFLETKTKIADVQNQQPDDARDVFGHFNQAGELLDQMDASQGRAHLLETMPYPAWLCNGAGNISDINNEAINYIGNVSSIKTLPISIDSQQQLSNAIEDVSDNNNSHLINVALRDSSNDRLPLIITPWGGGLKGSDLILVRIAVASWSANLSTAIQSSYKLTDAEIEVLEALVKGYSSSEIASLRQAKTETVRVQLKSIFRKTGTSSQVEVARLITGIVGASNFFCEPKRTFNNAPHAAKAGAFIRDKFQIQLPDGRRMTVHRCGAKNGDSFVYIHGYADNAVLPDDIAQILAENNLLAICPVRFGFGDSSPSPDVDDRRKATCDDLLFMTDYFGINQAVYVGMFTGGAYAYAMAAIHGYSVSDLILITCPILPISPEEIRALPANYRILLQTVRSSPKAMRFIIRIYAYLVRTNNFTVFWDAYFDKANPNADPDRMLLQSNDFRRSFMDSIRFVLAQGSDALFSEWLVLSGPSDPLDPVLDKPILMLRGSHDIYITQESVDQRKMLYPNVSSKIIEDAGAFLLFQKPQEVIKEIAAVVRKRRSINN